MPCYNSLQKGELDHVNVSRATLRRCALTGLFVLSVSSRTAADKRFLASDDAKEKDEPQKFLPDYDKLVKGKDAATGSISRKAG